MKIVIDIPEDAYKVLRSDEGVDWLGAEHILHAVSNGIPLPKGHGRLIDADKCIKQAWNDFYKYEEEWEKKDPDYVGVKRLHDQNGFECCLKTIGKSPTVVDAESEDKYGNI